MNKRRRGKGKEGEEPVSEHLRSSLRREHERADAGRDG